MDFGSLFAVMTFAHFAFDWFFQSEETANAKATNNEVRAKHSIIYSTLMTVPFLIVEPRAFAVWTLFFASHMLIDTYKMQMWWLMHVRKPKNLQAPINLILVIVLDQCMHLAFVLLCCFLVSR